MGKVIANSGKTGKRKPPANGWKPGQSGNPKGRPPEGESWAAVIKKISNMTGEEASAYISEFGKFSKALKGITLKEAVVFRCFAALMFEPQASMFNAVADRAEGKVADRQEITGKDGNAIEIKAIDYRTAIAALAPRPVDDSDSSSES